MLRLGPPWWRVVNQAGPPDAGSMSRPMAKRVRILRQKAWQWVWNEARLVSWGARDGGRGCWAFPLTNSAKFMALKKVRGSLETGVCTVAGKTISERL